MSRARLNTLLPLDRWAEILGLDPRHFNQVTTLAKPSTVCSTVWKQYAWQESSQVSREDVALAIHQAERMIGEHVGFKLLPTWEVDERVRVAQTAIPDTVNALALDVRGFPLSFEARWASLLSGGIEAKTVIEAAAAVVYTDTDGDGYPETATITATIPATVGITNTDEVAVYFVGQAGRDEWEIKPLNDPINRRRSVTIVGSTITIVCAREQLVDPDLWDALEPSDVDGNVDANFQTTVDVYWHRNDPQQQVTLMWAPMPNQCVCGDTTCPTCAFSVQTGCLVSQDVRRGRFRFKPARWDATTEDFVNLTLAIARSPDNLRIWYYAGNEDQAQDAPRLEMEPELARAVTYLSITLLTRQVCSCENVQFLTKRLTEDLAMNFSQGDQSVSFQVPDRILGNPWGTMRGAIQAWEIANARGRPIGQAVLL